MFNRLRGLFQRFARQHRHVEARGFPLDEGQAGRPLLGNVDRVVLRGDKVAFIGWSPAERITLTSAAGQSVTRPDIHRQDVADALGIAPRVGFEITQGFGNGRFTLTAEIAGAAHDAHVAPISRAALARERLRLLWRFLLAGLRALPAVGRFFLLGDNAARARVKAILGLNTLPEAGPMETRLFQDPDETPPPDPDPVPVTIVLPVYNAFDLLAEVLDRVVRNTDLPWHLVVIEDCSSDARVRPWLVDWVDRQEAEQPGRITLVLNEENRGFIRSVNSGFEIARERGHHVLLLNSDAFVPAGWASRMLRPMLLHEDVASVTPMSNDAEIFSVPAICRRMVLRPGEGDALDALARTFNPEATLSVAPTGVGFCMAMHIDWLRRVPAFDTSFGRGYGEEVDWCQKVRALGGRHLGLPGLFVEHRGGESFGSAEKIKLVQRNNETISRRYPPYDGEVQQFIAADPLVTARVALAVAWAAGRAGGEALPIYLAHSLGGGADRYLENRMARDLEARGLPSIVLRVGGSRRWQVEVVSEAGRVAGTTDDFAFVEKLLEPVARRRIVYSCGVGDRDPATLPEHLLRLRRKGDRLEVLVHDYFMLTPSYCLLDEDGIYRGPVTDLRADKAHQVMRPDGTLVDLAGWRAAWGALMAAADEIEVFSHDSRDQVARVYPAEAGRIAVRPHALLGAVPEIPRPEGKRRVIGVLGNIGYQKGAAVVRELGRLVEDDPETGLVLIGNIDPAYMPPASVPVHGDYTLEELPRLVARYGITDWLIPSVWPETFSYTTHEALATGLPVYAFYIGAQGEAVARAGNGHPIHFAPDGDLAWNVLNTLHGLIVEDEEDAPEGGAAAGAGRGERTGREAET